MAKMTRAQARKRLQEARTKVSKVMLGEFSSSNPPIPHSLNKDLMMIRNTLAKLINKL